MNYANKSNIPYVITVGSDEISQARYPLKNMKSGNHDIKCNMYYSFH